MSQVASVQILMPLIPKSQAVSRIAIFLQDLFALTEPPEFQVVRDGDAWAFWVHPDDTTSYLKNDGMIEYYGCAGVEEPELDSEDL